MVAGVGGSVETAGDFASLVACIEGSPVVASKLAATALAAIRAGVITGEGPTTTGRIHFSRSIDAADTAMIHRILMAGAAAPVTRPEADALFDIHEAALERADGGAFDDLFAKAIAHHVLAEAGRRVPARTTALSSETVLDDWAALDGGAIEGEVAAWLKTRLHRKRRNDGPLAALAVLVGAAASWSVSITAAVDLAA